MYNIYLAIMINIVINEIIGFVIFYIAGISDFIMFTYLTYYIDK